MTTLNNLFAPPYTPPAPGEIAARKAELKAAYLAVVKRKFVDSAARALKAYDEANRAAIREVFAGARATPQEILAALGEDGARIIAGSSGATAHIAAQHALAGAPYMPPEIPAGEFVAREDGSVIFVPEAVE